MIPAARRSTIFKGVVTHVILLLGQSNMVGKAVDYNSTDDPGNARILQYTAAGSLTAALDPLGHPDPATGGGPGLAFAREYLLTLPATHKILLIPASYGGTGFSIPDSNGTNLSWDISKANDSNNLYERSLTQLTSAITAAGGAVKIDGALLNVGGTDALNHMTGATFQTYIDALIAGYRTRLGLPNLPFVLGPSRPDAIAGNSWYADINTIQIATPGRVTKTAYIPGAVGTEFYKTTDTVHFNQVGHRAMGKQYANALRGVQAGLPTLTAPTGLGLNGAAAVDSIGIQWNAVTGATGYKFEYKTSASGTWLLFGTTAALSARPTGLTATTSYDFRVTATDGSNNLGTASTVYSTYTATGSLYLTPAAPSVAVAASFALQLRINPQISIDGVAATINYDPTKLSVSSIDTSTSAFSLQLVQTQSAGTMRIERGEFSGISSDSLVATINFTALAAASTNITIANANTTSGGSYANPIVSGATVSIGGVTPSYLGDVGVAAYRAYGLRKLNGSYAGSAVRVRRSSDNTEQDIGFTGSNLNTTALTTFVGSNSAYIVTWYDQSGNGRNMTQSTAVSQARLVNAGTLHTLNTKPCAVFDGTDDYYTSTTDVQLYAAGSSVSSVVMQAATPGSTVYVLTETLSTGGANYRMLRSSTANANFQITNNAGTNIYAASSGALFNGTAHAYYVQDSGSNVNNWLDGAGGLNGAYTRSGVMTNDRFSIGANVGTTTTGYFPGSLSEAIIWSGTTLTTPQRQAGEANQKTYFATP